MFDFNNFFGGLFTGSYGAPQVDPPENDPVVASLGAIITSGPDQGADWLLRDYPKQDPHPTDDWVQQAFQNMANERRAQMEAVKATRSVARSSMAPEVQALPTVPDDREPGMNDTDPTAMPPEITDDGISDEPPDLKSGPTPATRPMKLGRPEIPSVTNAVRTSQAYRTGFLPSPDGKPLEILAPPLKRLVGAPRTSPIRGVVLHQTWGSDTMDGNGTYSNLKRTGANYYIGKKGEIYQWAHDGIRMGHAGVGRGGPKDIRPDLTNDNTIGIEIMTRPHERPNATQIEAAQRLVSSLAKKYNFTPNDVVGHGEVAPDHRMKTEAIEAVWAIRGNGKYARK